MSENHIARLTREREELRASIRRVGEELAAIETYLLSSKFAGPDADYVHVRTDMLPKLHAVRFLLVEV